MFYNTKNKKDTLMKEKTQEEINTIAVSKLASKVSLLLTIMSFVIVIVSGGAIYTFTGLNQFKDIYAQDRLNLQIQFAESQRKNTRQLTDAMADLEHSIGGKMDNMNNRLNNLEKNMIKLQTKLDNRKYR